MEQEQRRYELNGGSQLQRQLEALPSPSDMADSNRWSQEQNHELFRCFRPTAGFGPTRALPVALYDPVLDTLVELFGAALKGGGDVGSSSSSSGGGGGADGVPLSNADCELASRLCEAMAESFAHEAARMAAFNEVFRGYLCEHIETHHPSRNWKFGPDGGSLLCQVGGPEGTTWLPVYIQEVKTEIGYSGDPYFKGQRRYQLDLTNPQLAAAVEHTVLPALFVELVGPHLRVSALASPADATVVCEPLTPYLHLFNMLRCQPDHMVRVALVLRALKSGIGLLLDACGRLQQPTAAAVPAPAAPAPASASEYSDTAVPRVEVPLRDQALQLPYPLRPGSGYRDVRPIGAGVYHPLYFAVLDGDGGNSSRAVAVKFARMSADALRVHRAWAAAGLAPEVVSTRRLPCGLIMLVMELLAPEDGWVMFYSLPPRRQQQLHGAVVAALARAHAVVVDADRGLCGVHADMRQANVMVRLPPPREDADGGGGGGSGGSGSGAAGRGVAAGGEGGGGGVAAGGGAPGGSGRDAGGGGGAAGGGGGEDAAGGGSGGGSQPQQQQVAQQVRFVDLDWAGLVGHTRLPAFARMRLQGYGCGCAVTQEYDRALWNWEWVFGPM
ncbi:hypothetical protein HXX76_016272 [Chlamydomonas incerta]|uniref:Protein kinase domain-containing protein n=1 Tax=Chlamydomonas incerta TaxID=51695 RepID=A0A835SAN9_CHLIN|nr:hypothetical protein HXX76_016272 [Chlamydomonas incerta]|eukprot:KAG2422116.1 hypothetical protein HXX76_016272 [Chlamydomonas incerta]